MTLTRKFKIAQISSALYLILLIIFSGEASLLYESPLSSYLITNYLYLAFALTALVFTYSVLGLSIPVLILIFLTGVETIYLLSFLEMISENAVNQLDNWLYPSGFLFFTPVLEGLGLFLLCVGGTRVVNSHAKNS